MPHMTIEALLEYQRARPFAPYRLDLADGQEIEVTHPECLAFHPRKPRTVGVALPTGGIKTIDLLLVVAIAPQNHRSRRRPRR